jgi:predicted transcriptional regulator
MPRRSGRKRSKIEIYFEILQIVDLEKGSEEPLTPTRLMDRAKLNYTASKAFLRELEQSGFIKRDKEGQIELTDRGREFIEGYRRVMSFLEPLEPA